MNKLKTTLKNSIVKINEITSFLPQPENNWQQKAQYLYKLRLLLIDLEEQSALSKKQVSYLKKQLTILQHQNILACPDLEDDEERKKRIQSLLLDDWIKMNKLDNVICFINC